jgi:Fic family protein
MIKDIQIYPSIGNFFKKIRDYLNDRQRKAINRLLDAGPGGFEGGMTNRKYAGITNVSRATAQRELADLVSKGILRPNPGGGRSASYDIAWNKIKIINKS